MVGADDRRQVPLHLTAEGETLTGELSEVGHLFTGQVADLLGDDLSTVTAALERLTAAATQATALSHEQMAVGDETAAR